jgi:hypothetical protein
MMKRKIVLFVIIGTGYCALTQTMVYTNRSASSYNWETQTIYIGDGAVQEHRAAWGSPKGIDTFAWVTRHEMKHHQLIMYFWPNGYIKSMDADGDLIPDHLEVTFMSGRPYDPTRLRTYRDTIGYSSNQYARIRDNEDICMRSQTSPYDLDFLWVNGSANHLDWASPGKQSPNKD